MFRYRAVFKAQGRKRIQRTIQAENYDDAFAVAETAVKRTKRQTGVNLQVLTVERLYGERKKKAKGGINWPHEIMHGATTLMSGLPFIE